MRRYFYVNERRFVVRFFDAESALDLADLTAIVSSPGAQQWMDNVSDFSVNGFRAWMNEKGQGNSFLFAIADMEDERGEGRVHAFVYVYPRDADRDALEVSYARRPDGVSGLTVDGLHLALEIVKSYLSRNKPWIMDRLKFVAEIEKGNTPSIKVSEKVGFVKATDFDRENNALWVLYAKEKLVGKRLRRIGRVRQNTGSYCGPATVQILAAHFGVALDQEQIVDAAGIRSTISLRGMSAEQMAKAVKNLMPGYSFWMKMYGTLGDIEKMVRVFNYPVGVNWQGIFERQEYVDDLSEAQREEYIDEPMCRGEEGHYAAVVDLDRGGNHLRIMDPYGHYAEADRFVNLQEFENRWWDDRMDYFDDGTKKYFYANRLMFAIVPKGVKLPEEIGMREI